MVFCKKSVKIKSIKYLAFIILFLTFPIFLDIFGSPVFIESRIGIPSEFFLIIAVFIFCLLRIFKNFYFEKPLRTILFLLFGVFGVVSVFLTIVNYFTYTNFVYNLTRLNCDKLLYLALTFGVLSFGSLPTSFFEKYYKKIIFFTPIFIFFIGLIVWMWPFEKMYFLTKEDGFVETSQFFVLFAGSIYAFLFALKIFNKSKFFAATYFFVAVVLFLIAGDEVSWGQRLLNLKTPENLLAINNQQEITIHNISAFEVYVTYGYVLLGFYGSIVSYILGNLLHFKFKILVFPPKYLFFYFFMPFCINLVFLTIDHNLKGFAEISELTLYLGVTVFMAELFYKTPQTS